MVGLRSRIFMSLRPKKFWVPETRYGLVSEVTREVNNERIVFM